MRILLTNDDGIESRGLVELKEQLSKEHEVWVVAPEKERSASSHSISLFSPVRVRRLEDRVFACDGTPADCVLLGIRYLIQQDIEAVLSGINRGPNLGTDILYSGTVAAARQGALMGKPSFAFSLLPDKGEFVFSRAVAYIVEMLPRFVKLWENDHFLNINFPPESTGPFVSCVTFPSLRIYRDHYESFRAPDNSLYCFLQGDGTDSFEEDGYDYCAVKQGMISVSPLALHPVNHEKEALYKKIFS